MNQRESRYVKVAKIAYRLTKQALPKYSHAKSPHHFELPQLAACVLVMFYLNKSYRDMEEWLLATDKVCQALELPRIPDHTTLQRTYRKLRKLDFENMKNQILEEENIEESIIASDSTGFSPGQASLYYQTRSGRIYEHWIKGAYAVGTESQYILSWQSGYGPSNDTAHLNALKRGCARFGTHSETRQLCYPPATLAVAAERVCTSNFSKIAFKCRFTVLVVINNFSAISLLVKP